MSGKKMQKPFGKFLFLLIIFIFLTVEIGSDETKNDLGQNVKNLKNNLKSMGYILGKERLYAGIEKGGRIIFTARVKSSNLPESIAFGATHDGSVKEFLFTIYEADGNDKIIRKLVTKKATSEILVELKNEKVENYHIEIELFENEKDISVVEILYGFIYPSSKEKPFLKKGEDKSPHKSSPLSDFDKRGYFEWGKLKF